MSICRLMAAAIVVVFSFAAAVAQEVPESVSAETSEVSAQEIPNWSAPPFWMPAKPRAAAEAVLRTEALEVLPSGPLPFVAIAPCRLLDTRNNVNPLGGGGPFATDEIRVYTLPGACGLPAGIQAVSLNVTATNTGSGAFGHIKVWPADQSEPNVSTLNYPGPGATVANAAIVPLSSTGAMKVKSGNATADVILDVNGYYGDNFDSIYVNEGQISSITSAMIVDGTIVNADISASAAIADTKLATIATSGKVADSALSANVTKLGPTIEASEITNITRTVSIPLSSFIDCQSIPYARLSFVDGTDSIAHLDTNFEGAGTSLHFDATVGSPDQNSEVCSDLTVPADYVSGGVFQVRAQKNSQSGAAEFLNCAGRVDSFVLGAPALVELNAAAHATYTCAPTLSFLTAGSALSFYLSITSPGTINEDVYVLSVAFEYTASQ